MILVIGFNALGPDPLKILPMLMPNMDPSTKRMCSIFLKCRELMELMQLQDFPPAEASSEPSPPPEPPPSEEDDPMQHLLEGLTPEQQSMMASLTAMFPS